MVFPSPPDLAHLQGEAGTGRARRREGQRKEKIERKKGKSRRGSATGRFTRDRRDLRRWTHRCVLTTLRYCGRFPLVRRAEEVGGGGRVPLVRRDSFLLPSNDPGPPPPRPLLPSSHSVGPRSPRALVHSHQFIGFLAARTVITPGRYRAKCVPIELKIGF